LSADPWMWAEPESEQTRIARMALHLRERHPEWTEAQAQAVALRLREEWLAAGQMKPPQTRLPV
jgi:hypothetical protein